MIAMPAPTPVKTRSTRASAWRSSWPSSVMAPARSTPPQRAGCRSLVDTPDIRGDLHMHTTYSDGRDPLESMVAGCHALGYEYVAITDHSSGAAASRTLARDDIAHQLDDIDAAARPVSRDDHPPRHRGRHPARWPPRFRGCHPRALRHRPGLPPRSRAPGCRPADAPEPRRHPAPARQRALPSGEPAGRTLRRLRPRLRRPLRGGGRRPGPRSRSTGRPATWTSTASAPGRPRPPG